MPMFCRSPEVIVRLTKAHHLRVVPLQMQASHVVESVQISHLRGLLEVRLSFLQVSANLAELRETHWVEFKVVWGFVVDVA